jgi:hypothetical protein
MDSAVSANTINYLEKKVNFLFQPYRRNQTDGQTQYKPIESEESKEEARQFTETILQSIDILLGSAEGWRNISNLNHRYGAAATYIRYLFPTCTLYRIYPEVDSNCLCNNS